MGPTYGISKLMANISSQAGLDEGWRRVDPNIHFAVLTLCVFTVNSFISYVVAHIRLPKARC